MINIIKKIAEKYNKGNKLIKLLYINILIFLLYRIIFVSIIGFLYENTTISDLIRSWISLPSNTDLILQKPWTLLSYMFFHIHFSHIFFNMICLYFGSKLFLSHLNSKQLVSTYILGGISGAVFFIVAFNIFPVFSNEVTNSTLIGASASVLAIFVAISTYIPNNKVQLPFFGGVKLKYIAIILITIDLTLMPTNNAGGHIGHIGGAFYGYLYIILLKHGSDLSINFYKFINYLSFKNQRGKKSKKAYQRTNKHNDDYFRENKSEKQKTINLILEKISKSGYQSLTKNEKETLFNASKK